jgi:hypothetical protein
MLHRRNYGKINAVPESQRFKLQPIRRETVDLLQ